MRDRLWRAPPWTRWRLLAVAVIAVAAACQEPEFDYGRPCDTDADCPDGYNCARVLDSDSEEGVCVADAEVDAGTGDGAVIDAAGGDAAVADSTVPDSAAPDSAVPDTAGAGDAAVADAAAADSSMTDATGVDAGAGSDAGGQLPSRRALDQRRRLSPSTARLESGSLRLEGRVTAGSSAVHSSGNLTLHGRVVVPAP